MRGIWRGLMFNRVCACGPPGRLKRGHIEGVLRGVSPLRQAKEC